MIARLSLRVRVTLAFVLASAVVLAALGGFLHQRLAAELDASITSVLRQRASDLSALAVDAQSLQVLGRDGLVDPGDNIAQVLAADGSVVAAAPGLTADPLLSAAEVRRAGQGPLTIHRRTLPGEHDVVRLLAVPAGGRVAVVGASIEERQDALANLDRLLLLGLPAALVVAALAGYLAAGRALRPVADLSRHAERLGAGDLAQRLPVPPSRDEVRRLADSLNAMLARLEDAFARERTFVADASHELRTPLARLKAELDLAATGRRSARELRDAVDSAAQETNHLITLANDLLVLARADQGRLPIRPEPTDLTELLRRVATRARPPAAIDAPPGRIVDVDPLRIEQALVNLVDNAARHGQGPVELVAREEAGRMTIHVRDHGAGFPPALRERAFERFTRGDAAREGDGAGLGLALVRAIADAHGADVGIADAPGGADVWLRLALRAGAERGQDEHEAAAGTVAGDDVAPAGLR